MSISTLTRHFCFRKCIRFFRCLPMPWGVRSTARGGSNSIRRRSIQLLMTTDTLYVLYNFNRVLNEFLFLSLMSQFTLLTLLTSYHWLYYWKKTFLWLYVCEISQWNTNRDCDKCLVSVRIKNVSYALAWGRKKPKDWPFKWRRSLEEARFCIRGDKKALYRSDVTLLVH